MKLLHCRVCGDIVRIYAAWRSCHCGKSQASYFDDTHVRLRGPCRAIGMDTGDVLTRSSGTWHESNRVTEKSSSHDVFDFDAAVASAWRSAEAHMRADGEDPDALLWNAAAALDAWRSDRRELDESLPDGEL